jgi:TrmH family RNA methyltransferase
MLKNIRIVLVDTSHPGNIGAAARAMKNMRLEQLCLITPQRYPSAEATARASGADDLLAHAKIFDTLDDALAGCRLVIGTSARDRKIAWPVLNPRECGPKLIAAAAKGEAALVFGRERSGLTNEELDRCNYLVHIPTNQEYSSLNLGAAVQVLAYEIYMAWLERSPLNSEPECDYATADMLQGFHQHLEQTLQELGFADPRQSEKLFRRLRSFFHRARPDREELNILRGILSAAQGRKSMRR